MKYEIKVNGEWVKVTHWIFRSWTGGRRINGAEYHGHVYFLGQRDIAKWA